MFLSNFSMFDFSSSDGATITGSWVSIASILMMVVIFVIQTQFQQNKTGRLTKIASYSFFISVVAILLFILDCKKVGAVAITLELFFLFILVPFLFKSIYSPDTIQQIDKDNYFQSN